MAKYTDVIRDAIIANFEAGDQPTAAQFTNWITRIQEGIEEHDHDGTGDGDGIAALGITGITGAGVDVPDDWYIGIGAALERIVFDAAGDISVMGANFGVGTLAPTVLMEVFAIGGGFGTLYFGGSRKVAWQGIGGFYFTGYDSNDNKTEYAAVNASIADPTDGTEDGYMQLTTMQNGALAVVTTLDWLGQMGVGEVLPEGRIHSKVLDALAIPTLVLEQLDISEGTINFIASDRGVITGATNSVKSVRVEVGGVVYRLAVYADA